MRKYVILIGHEKGSQEFEYNLITATKMYEKLKSVGCDVTLDTYDTEVYEEVAFIKSLGLSANDIVISIHYNAGGGDGFECYYYAGDNEMLELCKNIESEVIKNGQNSRGCKADKGFIIIKDVIPHSIILEGGFMDNPTDWKDINLITMGESYAKGVMNFEGISYSNIENYLMFNGVKYKVIE